MEIWHNPSCSKSRTALAALEAAGHAPTVRRYLDDPPTALELHEVLDRLGLEPWQIARAKEVREAGIDLSHDPDQRQAWIDALAANPRAIERPIVLTDDGHGTVARDPETLARLVG